MLHVLPRKKDVLLEYIFWLWSFTQSLNQYLAIFFAMMHFIYLDSFENNLKLNNNFLFQRYQ